MIPSNSDCNSQAPRRRPLRPWGRPSSPCPRPLRSFLRRPAPRRVHRLANSDQLPPKPEIFRIAGSGKAERSEEHTSELQSHLNLVCRLLLEKKKSTQV